MRFFRVTVCVVALLLLLPLSASSHVSLVAEVSWGAGASVAGSSPAEAGWRWPLTGGRPEVARRFEPAPQPWLPGHRGVDLRAAPGAIVVAAGPGVVRFAGVVVDRPVVSIAHADGLITTYEPVTPLVVVGEMVMAGQPIGVLVAGHAGCAGACLHWGLRRGSSYLDPLALLGRVRVRLLPLDGLVR